MGFVGCPEHGVAQLTEDPDAPFRGMLQNLNAAFLGIPKTGPGNHGRRERLGDVIDYLTGHRDRLRYRAFRRDNLPIATCQDRQGELG